MADTRRPKSATRGVMPGISGMTMTAGPDPARSTVRVVPPWANSVISYPPRASVKMVRAID